jgi:hypothetical protein
MSSTQSRSSKLENAGAMDIMEENYMDLMEWKDPSLTDEKEQLNFKRR